MAVVACILLALGALLSALNFYLSFIRYPIFRLRGGSENDFRYASGIPLVATGLLVCAA